MTADRDIRRDHHRTPPAGAPVHVDEEITLQVPLYEGDLPAWIRATEKLLTNEKRARHAIAAKVDEVGNRIQDHGTRVATLEAVERDADAAAAGARLARQLRALLLSAVFAVPAACVGAGAAFLHARDTAAEAAGAARVESAHLRSDLDILRAELSAVLTRLTPASPAGDTP